MRQSLRSLEGRFKIYLVHSRLCIILLLYTTRKCINNTPTRCVLYQIIHFQWFKTYLYHIDCVLRNTQSMWYYNIIIHSRLLVAIILEKKIYTQLYTTRCVLYQIIHFQWFKTYLYHIES